MIEFNPDGSLKLPSQMQKAKDDNHNKLKKERCVKVRKDVESFQAPKQCSLHITLSEAFSDNTFVYTLYGYFKNRASVPHSLEKLSDREFRVSIGSDFKRCTDCQSLVREFREFLHNNVLEENGNCTFKGRSQNFCYEDYFS